MDQVDIGLFDFDRHNALYYFVLNADEQIYLRYGGRDGESASTYLNLRSLELALEEGLKMHASGEIPQSERPLPLYAKDLPLLRSRTAERGQCVECHLIADYQNIQRELDNNLDRQRDMYLSPDIKTIGIHLYVPAGLKVDKATGSVAEAGMQAGDIITHIDHKRVRTFGDLQYYYDKVPRDSNELSIEVLQDQQPQSVTVKLPKLWWVTELDFRHWTVEPLVHFKTQPLTTERKAEYGFSIDGFAGEVTERNRFFITATPPLKRGDIIYGVDDTFADEIANTPELHIKLRHRAGSKLKLHVLRDQKKFFSELTTERQNFRKVTP
jgi:hypothetical protein